MRDNITTKVPCVQKLFSYKLRCYTMISSPEKGRNNTGKKICVSDADTAPAFRVTRSG